VPRVGNPRLQLAVVGQHHQPLAVPVKPSGRIDTLHRHEIGQHRPLTLARKLAKHVIGFVEKDQAAHAT